VQKSRFSIYLAAVLSVVAFMFLMLLIPPFLAQLSGKDLPSLRLGSFLFESFSFASLYIPVYFLIGAVLAVRKNFRVRSTAVLIMSIVPFLTFSLFLKVVSGSDAPAASTLTGAFGRKESAFLLFLLFTAELLSILVFYLRTGGGFSEISGQNARPLRLPSPDEPGPESGSRGDEPETRDEPPGGPAVFADLPEVPRFRDESVFGEDDFPGEDGLHDDDGFHDENSFTDTEVFHGENSYPEESGFPGGNDFREEADFGEDDNFREEDNFGNYDKLTEDTEEGIEIDSGIQDEPKDGETEDYPGYYEEDVEEVSVPESGEDGRGEKSSPPFRLEIQKVPENTGRPVKYEIPADKILNDYDGSHYWIIDEDTRKAADILKTTLEEFKIKAEVTGIKKGPVITMFEILPAPGVKLSKIVNLADNIALRLAASRIRIVAPIPGKHAVGIEVPNKHRAIVSFKEMLYDDSFTKQGMEIPVVLGKDITGESQIIDLVQTPHLLIAGATGSGKSVCVNSMICSILYKRKPEEVRLILIDPKIVELKLYNDIPHLLTPVITEPKRAYQALQYCIYEMERRYALLDSLGVRDIRAYNRKLKKGKYAAETLPYIVVIVDEFADLIAVSGKELESTLARLAAMARAVGIHLVLATQRPSIDVITGLIKANVPSRIAFMVANKIDSRIILDAVGADKLLGKGDMLFASSWDPALMRIQGAFVSDEEVERLTDYVKTLGEPDYIDEEIFFDSGEEDSPDEGYTVNDPLMDKSIEIVAAAGKASASYLQRRLKIGYNRAARIVEEMETRGIVGPQNGSKPREILHIPEKYRENNQ